MAAYRLQLVIATTVTKGSLTSYIYIPRCRYVLFNDVFIFYAKAANNVNNDVSVTRGKARTATGVVG